MGSKTVWHQPYHDSQGSFILTYRSKDLFMDFIIKLLISKNSRERKGYNAIIVFLNWLTKIVYYKTSKTTVTTQDLAEIIINNIFSCHGIPGSIVSHCGSFFSLKLLSSLCYFLDIKRKLSTAFYSQTDCQTKR